MARLLREFSTALDEGRIPTSSFRGCSGHPDKDAILIRIYPDDETFRQAVADLMTADEYEIKVEDFFGVAL